MRCVIGCRIFFGGEIQHHRDCEFYPDSLTRFNDDLMFKLQSELVATKREFESQSKHYSTQIEFGQKMAEQNDELRRKLVKVEKERDEAIMVNCILAAENSNLEEDMKELHAEFFLYERLREAAKECIDHHGTGRERALEKALTAIGAAEVLKRI